MRGKIALVILAVIGLAVWTWFWTGPELCWERQLYTHAQEAQP